MLEPKSRPGRGCARRNDPGSRVAGAQGTREGAARLSSSAVAPGPAAPGGRSRVTHGHGAVGGG